MKTRRAIITLMMAAILTLASCQAQAGELRSLPQWVRDLIEPIELAWLDMWERAVDSLQEVQSPAADVTLRTFAAPPAVELPDVKAGSEVALRSNEQEVRPKVPTTGVRLPNHMSLPQPIFLPALATGAVSANQGINAAGTVHAPAAEVQPVTKAIMPAAPGVLIAADGGSASVAVVAPKGLAGAVLGVETAAPPVTGVSLSTLAGVSFPRGSVNQNQITLVDTEVLTVLNGIRSLTAKGSPSEQQCLEWLKQNAVTVDLLARAVGQIPLTYPLDPVYAPMCSLLWAQSGEDVRNCLQLPGRGRVLMAINLGLKGHEASARQLLSTVTPREQADGCPLYIAAEYFYHAHQCPNTIVWALKRGAQMMNRHDEGAWWCSVIATIYCRWLHDTELTRLDLLPYAEEALSSPGSEPKWVEALPALLEGYLFIGEPQTAIERGNYWLEQAALRRAESPRLLCKASLMLGQAYISIGQPAAAAAELRRAFRAAPPDSGIARQAQAMLLSLAHDETRIEEFCLLSPKLTSVPENLALHLRAGRESTKLVTISGNLTFRVRAIQCSLPEVTVSMETSVVRYGDRVNRIRIQVDGGAQTGTKRGMIMVETNDEQRQRVDIPVLLQVDPPVTVQPELCFFGVVPTGREKCVTVRLNASTPFTAKSVQVVGPAPIATAVLPQSDRSYAILCTVKGHAETGVMEGIINVETDMPGQPRIPIPYYVHSVAAE